LGDLNDSFQINRMGPISYIRRFATVDLYKSNPENFLLHTP
jgi:hypothetical protein